MIEGSRRIYFAGDTDIFDGMADIGPVDVALLPVAGWGPRLGPGHMGPAEAVEALSLLRPRLVVPIHWGSLVPVGHALARVVVSHPSATVVRRAGAAGAARRRGAYPRAGTDARSVDRQAKIGRSTYTHLPQSGNGAWASRRGILAPWPQNALARKARSAPAERRAFRMAQLELLAEAGRRLNGPLDLSSVLARVSAFFVPRLADWYVLALTQADGHMRALAYQHRDAAKRMRLGTLAASTLFDRPQTSTMARAGAGTLGWLPRVAGDDWSAAREVCGWAEKDLAQLGTGSGDLRPPDARCGALRRHLAGSQRRGRL